MRLYAIDAPEMPGACRPGRRCTPGDPYASRDHLTALTTGKAVKCRQLDVDHYGRRVVQCFAASVDLSCRMVADGFAVERYGRLEC
ncbi:thermonuclease family protein [Polymorphobacter sp. PAMC 29334]|nr:thermonuclease family protein [Polymorphobacter sp. PAMC 29334]